MRSVRLVITGRVQAVGYRAWTIDRRGGSACAAGCATARTALSRRW